MIQWLKKGTTVYHGTCAAFDESSEDLIAPFWVSTSESVAENFSTWHAPGNDQTRVIEYKVKKSVRLALIESKEDMKRLLDKYQAYDSRELAEMMYDDGKDGWIIPWNYPDGDDIMLADPSILEYVATSPIED